MSENIYPYAAWLWRDAGSDYHNCTIPQTPDPRYKIDQEYECICGRVVFLAGISNNRLDWIMITPIEPGKLADVVIDHKFTLPDKSTLVIDILQIDIDEPTVFSSMGDFGDILR
jgi:hypothetical protein